MTDHPFFLVDAFADGPLTGNPAAVVLLDGPAEPAWMAAVAAEMQQSETAFCWRRAPAEPSSTAAADDDTLWTLRWYSPTMEVDLCGHATLATAHALWASGRLAPDAVAAFHTRSGLLQAWKVREPDGTSTIELDLPALPDSPVTLTQDIARALRLPPRYLGRGRDDFVVELESESAVRSVQPDLDLLTAAGGRCFIVTARAAEDKPWDFVLRVFAPALGVPEDPVTGSAFCVLGPYWALRLGRDELVGRQVSNRGGTVRVRTTGQRVRIGGRARIVVEGVLRA